MLLDEDEEEEEKEQEEQEEDEKEDEKEPPPSKPPPSKPPPSKPPPPKPPPSPPPSMLDEEEEEEEKEQEEQEEDEEEEEQLTQTYHGARRMLALPSLPGLLPRQRPHASCWLSPGSPQRSPWRRGAFPCRASCATRAWALQTRTTTPQKATKQSQKPAQPAPSKRPYAK